MSISTAGVIHMNLFHVGPLCCCCAPPLLRGAAAALCRASPHGAAAGKLKKRRHSDRFHHSSVWRLLFLWKCLVFYSWTKAPAKRRCEWLISEFVVGALLRYQLFNGCRWISLANWWRGAACFERNLLFTSCWVQRSFGTAERRLLQKWSGIFWPLQFFLSSWILLGFIVEIFQLIRRSFLLFPITFSAGTMLMKEYRICMPLTVEEVGEVSIHSRCCASCPFCWVSLFHCISVLKNHAAADLFPGGQFYLLYCIVVKLPAMRFSPYFAAELLQ